MSSIQDQLLSTISQLDLSGGITPTLDFPADPNFGDFASNIALQGFAQLSAEQRQDLKVNSPRDLAQQLVAQLQEKIKQQPQLAQHIAQISVDGPGFINFTLSDEYLKSLIAQVLSQPDYGAGAQQLETRWEIEHTSPNPNKAMHLGHLRNNVTAMAIANLWQTQGIKVIRDAVDNNRGIAIARLMWGYLKFAHREDESVDKREDNSADKREDESADIKEDKRTTDLNYWFEHQDEWLTPKDKNQRPDKFVDELYLKASEDFKNNSDTEQKVRQMVVDWELGDKATWALWTKVLSYSYQGQEMTLQRLGNVWDKVWHEHEHYQQGKELVALGLKKGIFKKLADGAVLTNLEKYNLPDTIVQKADGTSLYITQDIALTKLKKDTLSAQKLHWMVGPEQSLALKQLFAVCDQFGIARLQDLTHLSYGYMSIKGAGKMSSRLGNVVYIDDLVDAVKNEVKTTMAKNRTDFSAEMLEKISETVALGAIKYSILKVGRMSPTAFDLDSALRLDGNSGPYLQYTYVRANSVLEKAEYQVGTNSSQELTQYRLNPEEKAILRHISRYPTLVQLASEACEPSKMANFQYELSQKFNSFYNKHQILTEDLTTSTFRLNLTQSMMQLLKHGLEILGIEIPDKM